MSTTFAFNLLTEPSSYTTETLPSGFDAQMAWLLGQCCTLTYTQYDTATAPDLSLLTLGSNVTITTTLLQTLTCSESNGPQSTISDPGDYTTFPAGFVVVISQSGLPSPFPSQFAVVTLRGTQTWDEWISDAEGYPALYADSNLGLAFVHGGFYSYYTSGTLGVIAKNNPLDPSQQNRAPGSIAYQIAGYFGNSSLPAGLPIYVTGHSLGGGIAPLCALDIAAILKPAGSVVSMYSLAGPRPVMGFNFPSIGVPIPAAGFLQPYQSAVPNSYRIVHTCDIVPVLPPSTIISNSSLAITTAHVTDAWASNPGLAQNVVSFAAQTGDIAGNHSCALTYLPYLEWLASAG